MNKANTNTCLLLNFNVSGNSALDSDLLFCEFSVRRIHTFYMIAKQIGESQAIKQANAR